MDNVECIEHIKRIFNDFHIPDLFATFETESYAQIMGLIEESRISIPKEMFYALVRKIYKRQK